MGVGLLLGALMLLAIGLCVRRARRVEITDGVPHEPIEVRDDEIGHRVDGTVIIRQPSARLVTSNPVRLARGSVPPPFAGVAVGELIVPKRRPTPSVDDGWDLPPIERD